MSTCICHKSFESCNFQAETSVPLIHLFKRSITLEEPYEGSFWLFALHVDKFGGQILAPSTPTLLDSLLMAAYQLIKNQGELCRQLGEPHIILWSRTSVDSKNPVVSWEDAAEFLYGSALALLNYGTASKTLQ